MVKKFDFKYLEPNGEYRPLDHSYMVTVVNLINLFSVYMTTPPRIIRLNVKITGYSGLSVIWDNEQLVQIIAPGALKNSLCGLCGTFNDKAADDYVPKTSKVFEDDSNIFALSWQVWNTELEYLRLCSKKAVFPLDELISC